MSLAAPPPAASSPWPKTRRLGRPSRFGRKPKLSSKQLGLARSLMKDGEHDLAGAAELLGVHPQNHPVPVPGARRQAHPVKPIKEPIFPENRASLPARKQVTSMICGMAAPP
ncbi:MAG: hypothetical protein ACYDHE_02430 [Candidatus Acidiferrales bacterium]